MTHTCRLTGFHIPHEAHITKADGLSISEVLTPLLQSLQFSFPIKSFHIYFNLRANAYSQISYMSLVTHYTFMIQEPYTLVIPCPNTVLKNDCHINLNNVRKVKKPSLMKIR